MAILVTFLVSLKKILKYFLNDEMPSFPQFFSPYFNNTHHTVVSPLAGLTDALPHSSRRFSLSLPMLHTIAVHRQVSFIIFS